MLSFVPRHGMNWTQWKNRRRGKKCFSFSVGAPFISKYKGARLQKLAKWSSWTPSVVVFIFVSIFPHSRFTIRSAGVFVSFFSVLSVAFDSITVLYIDSNALNCRHRNQNQNELLSKLHVISYVCYQLDPHCHVNQWITISFRQNIHRILDGFGCWISNSIVISFNSRHDSRLNDGNWISLIAPLTSSVPGAQCSMNQSRSI